MLITTPKKAGFKSFIDCLIIRFRFTLGIFLIFMLCSGLLISLIPIQYTAYAVFSITPDHNSTDSDLASIRSNQDYIEAYKISEPSKIINLESVNKIIDKYDLKNRKELNIDVDYERALTDKLLDQLEIYIHQNTEDKPLTLEERIYQSIKHNSVLTFSNDQSITLAYTNFSPYIARAVANDLMHSYVLHEERGIFKKIIKKADLPEKVTVPDLKFSLYCAAIIGLVIALILTLSLYPDKKVKK